MDKKKGRKEKTHPELTILTNPHKCLKFCKIYHMLPQLMQTYASKLSCNYERPQVCHQQVWKAGWHHTARRKGRSWSLVLVLPFRHKNTSQYISHCFWKTPSKFLTWHNSLQGELMQTQVCTVHPNILNPRTSAVGLVQLLFHAV